MADHRLRRADRDPVGLVPEGRLDRPRLGHVVERRRRAVGDDVVDLVGRDARRCAAPCVIARVWPRPVGSGALMWNASAVRAPPTISATGRRAAVQRVRERLDDDDAAALAEDEAVAVAVERPRRASSGDRRSASTARPCCRARRRPSARSAPPSRRRARRRTRRSGSAAARRGSDDRRGAGGDLGHHRARSGRTPSTACAAPIEPDSAGIANGDDQARALRVVDVGPVDDLLDAAAARVDRRRRRGRAASSAIAAKSMPASATASLPAAIAKWMNRLIRRAIFASIAIVGSKSMTSAAIRTSNADASKPWIEPRPGDAGDEVAPVGREVVADRHDRAEAGDDGAAGTDQVRASRTTSGSGAAARL